MALKLLLNYVKFVNKNKNVKYIHIIISYNIINCVKKVEKKIKTKYNECSYTYCI